MRLELGDLVEALVAAEELEEADQALLAVEGAGTLRSTARGRSR